MKKIFTTLLLFIIAATFFTPAYAKQSKANKEKQQEQNRIEYLNVSWWNRYNDPILADYMTELYEKNHDLKIAALKVKEGEKMVRISLANELPQVSFDGNLGRTMRSSDQHFGSLIIPSYAQWGYQFPFTASYEIDIWGENRIKTKSVEKQLEIIKQEERASYIALTSAFASTYFNLVKTDKLLQIQDDIVKTQEEIAQKTRKKYENGLCSINEVLAEEKLLTVQKEIQNSLEHSQTVLTNQLRVYLSDNDKKIDRINCEELQIPQNLPLKISSTVVENRPDYIQAENYIKKVGYDVRIARKEFLPKFVIYGQLGLNAYQWSKLFNSYSQLANAGIMPSFDLFSGGRKMAILKLRKYQYEEAMHNYKKTILTSVQEINDSTAQLKTDEKNYKECEERLKLENQKYILMAHKNEIGAASNLEVLYNKEQQLLTQRDEVAAKINYIISTIGLYKAVGGKDLYTIENI